MKCPKCGADVVQSDRFCTNCGFSLVGRGEPVTSSPEQAPQQVAQQALQESAQPIVQQAEHPFTQHPSVQQAAEKAVSPHHRGLIVALSILGVIVVAVSLIISLMAFHVVANPLQKPRLVALKISAPRYQEGSDSKIPLHITGRTVSGRVISQHVYVSPKAASVRLEPGQYTVTVEASPLLSSGDVYRIPQPLKIDTASGSNFVGESKPMKQDLKFEVKPASEVTASDLQAMAKFAKKTATPVKKLDFLTEKIRRQKVSTAFSQVLDMLSTTEDGEYEFTEERYTKAFGEYSLLDIDQDGTPEMLTWFGVNGDKKRASNGPVGCGDEHDDFSGNRIWKYDSANNRAECLAGEQIPAPHVPSMQWFPYFFSSKQKMISIPRDSDEIRITIEGDHLHQVRKMDEELQANSIDDDDEEDWVWKYVFTEITQRDLLAIYAMSVPSNLTEKNIDDYDRYALSVSNSVKNGGQVLVGTIKLMTPKQVQEYQHKYVVGHHLPEEKDPTSTSDRAPGCPDWDDIKSCGNPASLYPADMLIPVFLPEGHPIRLRATSQKEDTNPWYLFRIGKYKGKKYESDDWLHSFQTKSVDNSFASLLTPYANKRILINTDQIWFDQYGSSLPWSQLNLEIGSILATLPEATGQAQDKAAQ